MRAIISLSVLNLSDCTVYTVRVEMINSKYHTNVFFFFRSDSSHSNTYKWICRQILISIFGQIFNSNMKKADDERETIYWKDVHLWWHLCLLHVEIFTKFRFVSFFPRLFNHSFSFYLSFCAVFVCFFIH